VGEERGRGPIIFPGKEKRKEAYRSIFHGEKRRKRELGKDAVKKRRKRKGTAASSFRSCLMIGKGREGRGESFRLATRKEKETTMVFSSGGRKGRWNSLPLPLSSCPKKEGKRGKGNICALDFHR